MTFRELVLELAGEADFPAHTSHVLGREGLVEQTQALHVYGDVVWEMNHVSGKPSALKVFKDLVMSSPAYPVLSRDVVAEGPGWLMYCVRRGRPDKGGFSVEHVVNDVLGGGALMRRAVRHGIVEHCIGSENAEGLQRVHAAISREAEGHAALQLRLVRIGDFRLSVMDVGSFGTQDLSNEDLDLLRVALESGYYDEPKRCGVRELGENLGFSKSVVARKLRQLERRALESFVPSLGNVVAELHS